MFKCKFNLTEKRVLWEITNRCNLNCQYCIFSANHTTMELTTKECLQVVDNLILHGFKAIKLTGGEPFIRQDILELLEYMCPQLNVDISTNGLYLTEPICARLSHSGLKMLHISLDGLQKEHELVRGKDTFKKTVQGIIYGVQSGIRTRIGCVINRYNQDQLDQFCAYVQSLQVDEIIFSIMEPVGRLLGKTESLTTYTKKELAAKILALRNKYTKIKISYNWENIRSECDTCPAGKRFIYINNLGQVSPCSWIASEQPNCVTTNTLATKDLKILLSELPKFQPYYNCQ